MTRTAEGPRLRRHAHFRVFSSHRDAMRTGAAVIVQRGDFVIAGGCGPFDHLIRCGFANELLSGKPESNSLAKPHRIRWSNGPQPPAITKSPRWTITAAPVRIASRCDENTRK